MVHNHLEIHHKSMREYQQEKVESAENLTSMQIHFIR
jgi:DNA-binding transcriptional regulator YiaG